MADQRFVCPNCGSDNIVRFSVAYRNGTSDIDTTTNTGGVGFAGGHLGIGGASGHTTGTQMTQLAQEVAPPKKMGYVAPIVIGIVVGFIVAALCDHISTNLEFVGLIAFAAVVYFLGYKKAYLYNRDTYPQLMAQWNQSWLCMKCGHKFIL